MTTAELPLHPAIQAAHAVLKTHVPGAAFDGEPFMVLSRTQVLGKEVVACNCYYHTVVFMPKSALVFTIDEGGMVPWVNISSNAEAPVWIPDPVYYDMAVPLPEGLSAQLAAATPPTPGVTPEEAEDPDELAPAAEAMTW